MPDLPGPHAGTRPQVVDLRAAETAALSEGAAVAVLDVPGVAGLEPALRNALHRLRTEVSGALPGRGVALAPAPADGVSLRRRGTVVDVHVDIAVSPRRPAALTAADVEDALRTYLTGQRLTVGTITVAVLALAR